MKEAQSYTKGTTNFLKECLKEVCENSKIVTFYVESLHMSLPHNLDIKTINHYLTNY